MADVLSDEETAPPYYWERPLFELQECQTGEIDQQNDASVVCYVDDDFRPVNRLSRLSMTNICINPKFYEAGRQCVVEIPLSGRKYMYLLVVADKRNRRRRESETLKRCLKSLRDMCASQAVEALDIPVDDYAISYHNFKETVKRIFEKTDVNVTLYSN
jgi:hypothetical protein